MISKNILSVLAVILALVMISPSILATTLEDSEILVDMESAHESEYDELVNVSGNSTESNYDTWNPAPQGLWIGSNTKETHFQLGAVTSTNSTLSMTWAARFSSSQIMSGVSEFTLRLPLYIDASVTNIGLYILAVDVVLSHNLSGAALIFSGAANQKYIYQRGNLDPTDTSVMDGNDVFVRDNRMYVNIIAPLFPGQIYVFDIYATYAMDANPSWFIAPNDVISDGVINSWVGWTIPTGPGTSITGEERLDLDWGASYDMRGGMGNGITALQLYFNPGDTLLYTVWAPYALGVNGHHTIDLPFYTETGEANFSVTVTHRGSNVDVIQAANTTYEQVILASNSTASNRTAGSIYPPWDNMFIVNLTSAISQYVTFYFRATPLDSYAMTGVNSTRYSLFNPSYLLGSPYPGLFGNDPERFIGFAPISAYLVCPTQIDQPVMGSVVEPEQQAAFSIFSEGILKGIYLFGVKVLQSGVEYVADAFDIQNPGEAVVVALSIASGGAGVAWWIVSALTDLPTPLDVYRSVAGIFENILDKVWDALKALGNFLWSIGEYVYDALQWLADQIVEYGAYLLGLLIIAAALLIFFFPIHYQLKLWTAALLLAQGKIAQAQGQVEDVAKDIGNKAGKVGGML